MSKKPVSQALQYLHTRFPVVPDAYLAPELSTTAALLKTSESIEPVEDELTLYFKEITRILAAIESRFSNMEIQLDRIEKQVLIIT